MTSFTATYSFSHKTLFVHFYYIKSTFSTAEQKQESGVHRITRKSVNESFLTCTINDASNFEICTL